MFLEAYMAAPPTITESDIMAAMEVALNRSDVVTAAVINLFMVISSFVRSALLAHTLIYE